MDEIYDLYNLQIAQSKSSIFAKEDVLKLLQEFYSNILKKKPEEQALLKAKSDVFNNFQDEIENRMARRLEHSQELVDYSSAQFSIDYGNQLVVDHIDINIDLIYDTLNDILLDEFQKHFGELE